MDKVFLKRSSRVSAGHLWIFSNELSTSPKKFDPGSLVQVYDNQDRFIGIGYINPQSLISVRLLTRAKKSIDADFFRNRIIDAVNYRKAFFHDSDALRIIYSEGDFVPGLIVDKYGDCLVVQFLTLGIEKMGDMILNVLDDVLSPAVIVLRNDSQSRILEGLPLEKRIVKGSFEEFPVIHEGEIAFEIDPMTGQKTGFFLDQRENRIALSEYIKGGRGLDLFCYSGAWGLHLANKGATVTGVDDSWIAIEKAKKNAELNSFGNKCSFIKDDVFNFLKREEASGNLYDFVVLDPPAFVKSKVKIKEALRGYRELNSMAMKIVREGGILATSSCSYHIEKTVFIEMLRDSAKDAKRIPRLLEYRSQGRDHPVLLTVPETGYLKCAFLKL
ncbi:MAG: class I SAM-dependent rRNA methyltransferase [Thermodesulfovibrionales bacterium]|nr:class I SAM-dependent rRNA methyltransferase [Thermodesulfovibrionales bacterium]